MQAACTESTPYHLAQGCLQITTIKHHSLLQPQQGAALTQRWHPDNADMPRVEHDADELLSDKNKHKGSQSLDAQGLDLHGASNTVT
jgi:hypothetical protein